MSRFDIRLGEEMVQATLDPDGAVRIADDVFRVSPMARGLYRVTDGLRRWTVAVAGPADDRWLFVDGHVARIEVSSPDDRNADRKGRAGTTAPPEAGQEEIVAREAERRDMRAGQRRSLANHELASPMPATVVRVLVERGATVARGDTLLMLEAMKMELPIRAPRDGVVRAIHCVQGDLVQPGVNLLDLE